MEKLKSFIKSEKFFELFRFCVTGFTCFVIDWCIMMLLMTYTSSPDWLSIAVGFTVSVIVNYFMCVLWVFKNTGKQSLKSQFVFVGSSVVGLGLTEVLMLLFMMVIPAAISKVIVTLLVMVWNYVMKRVALYNFKNK